MTELISNTYESTELVNLRDKHYNKNNERLDKKIIDILYGVMYIINKEDHPNFYFFLFLTVTEFLEFLSFPFDHTMLKYWDGNVVANRVIFSVSYVDIKIHLIGKSAFAYLLSFYICVFIIILVCLNISYVFYSFSRNYFTYTWPLSLLCKSLKIFVSILFIPFLTLFVSVFLCNKADDGLYYSGVAPELQCYGILHGVTMCISLIVIFLFSLICAIQIGFSFDLSFFTEDFEAK